MSSSLIFCGIIVIFFQFTLYSVLKGNKPDFHAAMSPDTSRDFYEEFLKQMRAAYNPEYIKGTLILYV